MFKYAVRVDTRQGNVRVALVDWPEVSVVARRDPLIELKAALLGEIARCVRSRTTIRVPKAKPSSTFFVRLSPGEALKVIVINETFASGGDFRSVAQHLNMGERAIKQALDLAQPADVELLNRILAVGGKRLLAYTVAC